MTSRRFVLEGARGAYGVTGHPAPPTGPSKASDPHIDYTEVAQRGPLFYECFAGSAGLSAAVRALGLPVVADEASQGGTNFAVDEEVASLKGNLEKWQADGRKIALHLAPPCSTFSRARDRGSRTRLRSKKFPAGLPGKRDRVQEANRIALAAWNLASWAASRGMLVSMENPRTSYLWEFVEEHGDGGEAWTDVAFAQCRFGAPHQKPTTLRCWNWHPHKLGQECRLQDDLFMCGRSRQEGHQVLEFGGGSTAAAAAYPKKLCETWALEVAAALGADTAPGALERVQLARQGRVRRHELRGAEEESARERRRAEDDRCLAGMRNPAALIDRWPRLWQAMDAVKKVLVDAHSERPDFQGLTGLCGDGAARGAPTEEVLRELRIKLAEALGADEAEADLHHSASPWRYALVRACQLAAEDPDEALAGWLQFGAPMGLTRDIQVGGLFPEVALDVELTVEELDGQERITNNHPSFEATFDSDTPPGVELMKGYVQSGFGRLFRCADDASKFVGREVHPAPMGTVSKLKDDGSWKHRPIQDLRRNSVNAAVRLPERQVLPRPIDHALDLVNLNAARKAGESLVVLILDFKDACMSIPLHADVQPFNCTRLTQTIERGREPLDKNEPAEGNFILWRVLGFGGKPNPPRLLEGGFVCHADGTSFVPTVIGEVGGGSTWPTLRRRPGHCCQGASGEGLAGLGHLAHVVVGSWHPAFVGKGFAARGGQDP